MVFKQIFKCLKNEKINFIKVILKLEYLLYQNIYMFYFNLLYIFRAISTQTNAKRSNGKKNLLFNSKIYYSIAITIIQL